MQDWEAVIADGGQQRVAWVREAAGARFNDLELHIFVPMLVVTENRQAGLDTLMRQLAGLPQNLLSQPGVRPEDVLASPHALVGSVEQIVERLQERRERLGLSYITIRGAAIDDFAPVVARLAGT